MDGFYADGVYHLVIGDVASGSELFVDNDTGAETGREIPDGVDASRVNALFDQIIASVETPGWGGSE